MITRVVDPAKTFLCSPLSATRHSSSALPLRPAGIPRLLSDRDSRFRVRNPDYTECHEARFQENRALCPV